MQSKHSGVRAATGGAAVLFALAFGAQAPLAWSQDGSGDVRPAPRWPDGRISFTAPPGEVGN